MSTKEWQDTIDNYMQSMRAAGRRPGTVRLHRHYLGLRSRLHGDPATVTRRILEDWFGDPCRSPETRKSARSVSVVFFRWATAWEVVAKSPAEDLMPIKVPTASARPAPKWVYHQALVGASREVRLMLKLARLCGLRASEIASVSSHDLDEDLLFVTRNGGKQRIVPVADEELRSAIAAARGWLFPSPHGGHYTAGWVTKVVGRALPVQWTAHQLRHAAATRSYERQPDVLPLGKVLGHSKPETTLRHVATPMDSLRAVVSAAA